MADVTHDPGTTGANPTAPEGPQPTNPHHGRHATGPKTPQGKAISRLNAIRHGLRSNRVVLPGIESEEEWAAFRDEYLAELAPVGRQENDLAERIAGLTWRLQRVEAVEAAAYAADLAAKAEGETSNLLLERTMAMIQRNEAHLSRELDKARKALGALQHERRSWEHTARINKAGGAARYYAGLKAGETGMASPPPGPVAGPPLRSAAEQQAELQRLAAEAQRVLAAEQARVQGMAASGRKPGGSSVGQPASPPDRPAGARPPGGAPGQPGPGSSFGKTPAPEALDSSAPPA